MTADRQRVPFMCFNTQPPEGGWSVCIFDLSVDVVSTHSRPKAAGFALQITHAFDLFQHTAARRRLDFPLHRPQSDGLFQHTAARRRLGM